MSYFTVTDPPRKTAYLLRAIIPLIPEQEQGPLLDAIREYDGRFQRAHDKWEAKLLESGILKPGEKL